MNRFYILPYHLFVIAGGILENTSYLYELIPTTSSVLWLYHNKHIFSSDQGSEPCHLPLSKLLAESCTEVVDLGVLIFCDAPHHGEENSFS